MKCKVQSVKCKVKAQNLKFFVLSFSFTLCALSFVLSCFAGEEANLSASFYKGNAYYEQAKYDEAIAEYKSVLDAGYESGNIYYNLGNAYFKKGKIGMAVLNYKRARRLMPHDMDLKANLDYASSTVGQPAHQAADFFVRLLMNALGGLSVDFLTVFLAALYAIIFACAICLLFTKKGRRFLRLFLLASCVVFIIVGAGLFIKMDHMSQPWAVVLEQDVEARYEPFDTATVYFNLFQGEEVLLVKSRDGWAFIKRPDGKAGWVKASSVEKI